MQTVRRHREDTGDYFSTLLNSVTLDQLRTALFRSADNPPSVHTKDEAIEELIKLDKVEEISNLLLDLEATTPTKHCVLMKYDGKIDLSLLNIGDILTQQTDVTSLYFKIAHRATDDKCPLITFEHKVNVCEWKTAKDNEDIRIRENFVTRHPVILRVDPRNKIVVFFYPGFSQGSGIKKTQRINYHDVLLNLIGKLEKILSISFSPIPVQACVKALTEAASERIKVIRTDFESGKGRMSLAAPSSDKQSVDEYLTSFITPYVKENYKDKLHSAVREALKNTTPNSLAVLWTKEDLITRLAFWDFGTEFLFIWYGSSRSMFFVKSIISLIVSITERLETPTIKEILDNILTESDRRIFTISSISANHNVSENIIKESLVELMNAGLIKPVYRIKTPDMLLENHNDWTERLAELRRGFTTENNEYIDGSDPRNIEVAFKRIAGDSE